VRGKTLWQCYQQAEADLRRLETHLADLRSLKTPPAGVAEDVEMAHHHLNNALFSMKKELARRKKLTEEYHRKVRQPD
jgi:hypothetical protein